MPEPRTINLPSRLLLAPLLVVVALATAASARAAPAAPTPRQAAPNQVAPSAFRHDLNRVNGHLRIAVEYAPEKLTEALWSAENVCGLGERAASRGEADLATADWATLDQLVGEVAETDARRVDLAFANSDSTLALLRDRFEPRWAGDATRSKELRRGVGETRRGIVIMRAAIAGLSHPFQSWRARQCPAATIGIQHAFAHVTDGLTLINAGMVRLWRLAISP